MTRAAKLCDMCGPHWREAVARQPVARIWRKDHTLWKPEPEEITNRLGWLDLPNSMQTTGHELARGLQRAAPGGGRCAGAGHRCLADLWAAGLLHGRADHEDEFCENEFGEYDLGGLYCC